MMSAHRFLVPLTAIFVGAVLLENSLNGRMVALAGLNLPAAMIVFPLSYLANDVITEVYGFTISRRVIWSGLVVLAIVVSAHAFYVVLSAVLSEGKSGLVLDSDPLPQVAGAASFSYLLGEFAGSYIIARLKVLMSGKLMFVRFLASVIAGQFLSTALFIAFMFAGTFAAVQLIESIALIWIIRTAWASLGLPFALYVARWLKQSENEDYYDRETDFNPIRVS